MGILRKITVRNDSQGHGYYGAPRGSRKHNGVDLVVEKGDQVLAPENGVLKRSAQPYSSDPKYKGFVLVGDSGLEWKVFYCILEPNIIGTRVSKGQHIATAQAISEKYNSSMIDHIHVEIRKDEKRIDPTDTIMSGDEKKKCGNSSFCPFYCT